MLFRSGVTASSAITIVVNAALTISGTNQIFATNGRSFSTSYTASGGTGNKTWAISGLNPKISIDANGILTIASDLTVGIYYETVTVTDEKSVQVIKSVTIQINDSLGISGPTLILNTFSHTLNSDTYTVTGGTGTKIFSISSDSGISINSNNGSITVLGTVAVGDHLETITVTRSEEHTSELQSH